MFTMHLFVSVQDTKDCILQHFIFIISHNFLFVCLFCFGTYSHNFFFLMHRIIIIISFAQAHILYLCIFLIENEK